MSRQRLNQPDPLTKALQPINLTFDATTGTLQFLDSTIQQHTQDIITHSEQFAIQYQQFQQCIDTILTVLQHNTTLIDHERMRALGLQSQVEATTQQRTTLQHTMQQQIATRKAQLQRLKDEYGEMTRIDVEQKHLIERLQNM